MNLFDRITLLRAGYTRKEIDAMIEEDQRQSEAEDKKLQEVADIHAEDPKKAAPEPETKKPEENPPKPEEPDYKAKYEAEKAEKEALQEANRRRDTKANDKSDQEALADLVSSFL